MKKMFCGSQGCWSEVETLNFLWLWLVGGESLYASIALASL